MRKEKLKFHVMYHAVIFIIYFLIATIFFALYTGSTMWTLSFQTVPVWVMMFFLSFFVTCIARKYLGFKILGVAVLTAIIFTIHFVHNQSTENEPSMMFAYFFIPSYAVFFVHTIGQGVYEKWLKK